MKRRWCVYGYFNGSWGVGRLEKIDDSTLWIRYSEGQMFPLQAWDAKRVKRFDTHKEAVDEFFKTTNKNVVRFQYIQHVKDEFPGEVWD